MRAIDADELYRAKFHGVAEIVPPDEHSPESYKRGWNDAIDAIADKSCTPTIEPERKIGRWININDSEKYQCSECGITMWFPKSLDVTPDTYIFCPHCGAEMTEEKKKSGRTNHERTNKGYLR